MLDKNFPLCVVSQHLKARGDILKGVSRKRITTGRGGGSGVGVHVGGARQQFCTGDFIKMCVHTESNTHAHTHSYINICVLVMCVCVCVYIELLVI